MSVRDQLEAACSHNQNVDPNDQAAVDQCIMNRGWSGKV